MSQRDVYHTGEREKKQTLCVYKISTDQERSRSKLSRDPHLEKHPQFMKAIDLIPVFTLSFCLLLALALFAWEALLLRWN